MLKIAPKTGNFAGSTTKIVESATNFAYSASICGIQDQIKKFVCLVNLSSRGILNYKWNPQLVSGIRKLSAESINCKRNPHIFAEPTYFCGIRLLLRNSEQLLMFACCGIRDKANVPKQFTLQVFVPGIHRIFISGSCLHFGTCLKTCLWNSGTYRHKIVQLSNAPFGLVMTKNSV